MVQFQKMTESDVACAENRITGTTPNGYIEGLYRFFVYSVKPK